jgi:hypothetical protein
MSLIWPINALPYPSNNTSFDNDPNLSVTEFEYSIRQRERFSGDKNVKSVSWLLNEFQLDFFQSYVKHTLKSGSLKFFIEIPGLGGIPLTEARILGGRYSASKEGIHWRITASLFVEAQEVGSSVATNLISDLTDGTPEEILCLLNRFRLYMSIYYGSPELLPSC